MKNVLFPLVAAIALTGCVNHTWAPGPHATGDFGMVSGNCKLVAMGQTPSHEFFAAGNAKFVAAATAGDAIGTAIGSAVRQNQMYNACMEANGFVATEGTASAAPPTTTASAASPPAK